MPIDFPNSPSNGQTFTSGERTWTYNGSVWNLTSYGAQGPQGATGAQGATGSTGFVVCTSSTRPGSPTTGQNIYETDTGDHLVYYGATTGWRPPWHAPWGTLLFATDLTTRTYSTTASVMTGFTGSVSTVAGRKYKISISLRAYNAGAAGFFSLQPRVDSTAQNTFTGYTVSTSFDQSFSFYDVYTETVSSTRTFDIRASAGSGTLSVSSANGRAVFLVEDIGPTTSNPPAS